VESGARQGIVELLGRVPLFSELSPDELDRVAQVAIPRTFPRDTRVFHEGDSGDACYIVNEGTCLVTRQHSDGRTITLATLGPGTIFGELAMFDGERRSASVEAAENTELLALPASDMKTLIREHPGMAEKLIVALTERYGRLRPWAVAAEARRVGEAGTVVGTPTGAEDARAG